MSTPARVACPDCGTLQGLPILGTGELAQCRCCGRGLLRQASSPAPALALTLAAALLWAPACLLPLLTVTAGGAPRTSGLAGCVAALWNAGYASLAVLVAVLVLVVPSAYLLLLAAVLVAAHAAGAGRRSPHAARLFRYAGVLQPWLMLEVFVVGGCVAYSRMQSVAAVAVDAGGWCLITAALLLLSAIAVLDRHGLWRQLAGDAVAAAGGPPREAPAGAAAATSSAPSAPAAAAGPAATPFACRRCELLLVAGHRSCPRCGAPAHPRKPRSLERTWALVLTGFVLYLPANLLPVISIERYGARQASTILGGVRELIRADLWPLALIVFTASVVVPLAKLGGLSVLLWFTRRGSARFLAGRTRVYRLIDIIGRWSNIDVFMISLLVALVQFGSLSRVKVESGAIAFAAVVIVTMLAARSFDARIMWDAARQERR